MKRFEILIETAKSFTSLKDEINNLIKNEKGIGVVNVFVAHATCAIKVMESEILLLSDIDTYLRNAWPESGEYRHDIIGIRDVPPNERINGHSHMRQLFFSCDVNIPANNGKLDLGIWQDVLLIEFDPFRERKIIITYYK